MDIRFPGDETKFVPKPDKMEELFDHLIVDDYLPFKEMTNYDTESDSKAYPKRVSQRS